MRTNLLAPAYLAVALLAAACSSGSIPASPASAVLTIGTASAPSFGVYLTGPQGKTLYVLTSDGPDATTCLDSCAAKWPPLTVAAGQRPAAGGGLSGELGTFTRPDGTTQVTYQRMPLYYFAADSTAGDAEGQGVGGVWFVATITEDGGGPSTDPDAGSY